MDDLDAPVIDEPDEPDEEPDDPHRPEVERQAFDCPRCGAYAHMDWNMIGVPARGGISSFDNASWNIATCARCRRPSVWRGEQMIYPLTRRGSRPHVDMPDEVRALYEEAAAVAVVSRRAGAALARATVERLIKHLDPDAPKKLALDKRIERIKALGVSTPVGQMLDVVRVTGNGALHVD
ncbi:DUF4145 domain-containing protein, partial [Actinophytocola sp.]|uniref:DUF4145 domain-containing protein n=1 Tax=Actinophytocola sp. TaxID=1872138 RepID=UPI002ED95C5D